MKKEKITLEYPLGTASQSILWDAISTPLGLAEWFAETVSVEDNKYTFSWEGGAEQVAYLCKLRYNEYVRFQWENDYGSEYYFELRIAVQELVGDVAIIIIDFAEEQEGKDVELLWNKQMRDFKRKYGLQEHNTPSTV